VTTVLAAAALLVGLLLIFASLRGRWRAAHSLAALGPDIEGVQFDEPVSPSPAPPLVERKPSEGAVESVKDAGGGRRPDPVYGWLQLLDADSTKVPVTATTVRIGRHPDNDICLPNKTVHRQHAVLHKTTNGAFVIRDLGTKNGLIVNGKRCSEHTLADNDLIELGEVRLRFASKEGNLH
jgi:pSer/pThr/pTyr-binding forkhead associated (FHA) protein